jgi:uncharacterized membrane protein YkvA (DUF1232 family)
MNPLRPTPKLREIPTLVRSSPTMFLDILRRRYREIPVRTLAGAFVSLVYLINPLDLVPDVIPFLGVVDDSLVFGLFLALLSSDVKKYLIWKKTTLIQPTSKDDRSPNPPTSR